MDERLQPDERLQRQYKRDLSELHQQAAEFGKALKLDLLRTPWRPRDKQDFELILATVGNPDYTTQLAHRRRPWPLSGLYTPSTILTIPRELLHMTFAHVFTDSVFCSLGTFVEWIVDYYKQASNPDYVIHHFVPDGQGNIIPELFVAADALPGEEDKDIWEERSASDLRMVGYSNSIWYRNKHRLRQVQTRNPDMIYAQSNQLLDLWPEKSEDIEYCTNKALELFHKDKWSYAKSRTNEVYVRIWDP